MDKLLKTIETLKMPSLSNTDANIPGTITSAVNAASDSVKTKKNERINHCRAVTDAVCTSSVQGLTDYNKILESVTEVLFQLSDDSDSDIRLVASDCLNRIAKTLKDTFQPKFHMEVYKEIRKNQSARSLRTALNLFAFICPSLRPQKYRAFLTSLLPCFNNLSKRTEEILYENFAVSFNTIFKQLGPYAHDSEIKILCKDFLCNLESTSAIIRRASASILVSICRSCKKPEVFIPKLLTQVTELLMPNLMEKSVSVIIGVLLCIRQTIPVIYGEMRIGILRQSSPEQESLVANLLQVYEMCMILCNHDDHNVITTSLETLQQLFTDPVESIALKLTSHSGIKNSLDDKSWSYRHADNNTLGTSAESLNFPDESANLLEADLEFPKFRSLISSTASELTEGVEIEPSVNSSRRGSDVFIIEGTMSEPDEVGSSLDGMHPSDDETGSKSVKRIALQSFPDIQIGSLYEQNAPIYYCARFLAYNFLLTGQTGSMRPDGEVRTTAKVLATNCIVNLIEMDPDIYNLPLSPVLVETEPDVETQKIRDLCLYTTHNDPLLRGSIYILVGAYIKSQGLDCFKNDSHFDPEPLVGTLKQALFDSSNVGVKCAISGVSKCLKTLLRSKDNNKLGQSLFFKVLQASVNPYWLVKVDLIELVTSVEWEGFDNVVKSQERVLDILLEFLSDEDSRVRSVAASAFSVFMKKCATGDDLSCPQVFCKECVINEVNIDCSILVSKRMIKCNRCDKPSDSGSDRVLETVLKKLLSNLAFLDDKYSIAGYFSTLALISENYDTRLNKAQWRNKQKIGNMNMFLEYLIETLRSSHLVYDLSVHQSILLLTGNVFLASDFFPIGSEKEKSVEEGNPFRCCHVDVANQGVQLLQHCLAVMKLYQRVMENTSPTSTLRKHSTSPVISPVKKFSQKLEAEKKSQESDTDKKAKGLSFSDTVCQSHFKKISDGLHQTWKVNKSSLDSTITAKFVSLLTASLNTFCKLFTYVRPDYPAMTSLIDEVLSVSSAIFHICPIPALKCIQEMLKCIFSAYNTDFLDLEPLKRVPAVSKVEDFVTFFKTYETSLVETRSKGSSKSISDKSTLGKYIRQFESAVVTALRIYTTNSDIQIQAEVMSLLSQLVRGHVNYGLVDSSQVFLGYVLKQIVALEEGHIRNGELLTQEIFLFLTLLSHEQNSSKKFIDLSKVLRLCDSLVSVGEKLPHVGSLVVPALKLIVNDLFINLGCSSHSNLEKFEHDSLRVAALEMVLKLTTIPEILPVLWILLKGRKIQNEMKWNNDCYTVVHALIPKLQNGELVIRSKSQFNNLVSLLYSMSISSMPSQENLLDELTKLVSSKNEDFESYLKWCINVNTNWIMLVKVLLEDSENEISSSMNSCLVFGLIETFFKSFRSIMINSVSQTGLICELIGSFVQFTQFLLKSEKLETLKIDLRAEVTIGRWITITLESFNARLFEPRLHLWIIDLLSSVLYPHTEVWKEGLLRPLTCLSPVQTFHYVLTVIRELNDADVSTLEEWIIVHYTYAILRNMNNFDIALFLNRLSTYRMEQILDQITIILSAEHIDLILTKCILKYLEKVSDTFLCETAVLGIKLLQKTEVPFLALEISQFVCYVLSHIRTRKLLFSNRDREVLKNFLSDSSVQLQYQRLVILACKVLSEDPLTFLHLSKQYDSPIVQWCCEEVNHVEGNALAKMLSTLKYSHITVILSKQGFNLSLLEHCFRNLKSAHRLGAMSSNEVIELFSSQKRSSLIDKWPLAVAAVEHIVETLDAWENLVQEPSTTLDEAYAKSLYENFTFNSSLSHMWSVLTEMLNLKKDVMQVGDSEVTECCNNFIPTKIFTMSFQYMAAKCSLSNNTIPFEDLLVFLEFASVAVCDSSFQNFFDVRDNPPHIFACITSLGSIVRSIAVSLNINYIFSLSGTDLNGDMNDDCVKVLTEFHHLTEFVQQAKRGKFSVDFKLLNSLKNVVAGLGRCELVNGWILISHLGWRPQVLSKSQIFPPIQQIPLDILRNEVDMLLKYINKLNLLGVSNKIQFEENWVIFLSVINLYVDEDFEMPIVTTGMRALSMMLRQSIKVSYIPSYKSESMKKAATKIQMALADVEPIICKQIEISPITSKSIKQMQNDREIDVNSCIRFLTDLYNSWLRNPQGKVPLMLLSEVIQSIIVMSEYFEDVSQYSWMYEMLGDAYKYFEREDDNLWPHLIFGLCYAGSKLSLEGEGLTFITQMLESSITNPTSNVAHAGIKSALAFLQNNPENTTVINIVAPFLLKGTQLDEITNDSESHCCELWNLLLFIWIHGPKEGITIPDFEQEIVRNILTVLSPLNKVYVSVRLIVLEAMRVKVELGDLKPEIKKTINKVSLEALRTPNIAIFCQSLKLYLTIFYADFSDYVDAVDLDPEVLMPMAERSEVLFQQLKSNVKCNAQIVSKVLPLLIIDFLPQEILNRVIAEFMSPMQTSPELMAPVVAHVFEKARKRTREAALVKEWILASLPNFVANADISRTMWSLTLFFIGVSSSPDVVCLLPFSQLRRRSTQIKELFIHSALDFYSSLEDSKKKEFKKLFSNGGVSQGDKKPYSFLINHLEKQDSDRDKWAIDRISSS